MMDVLLAHSGYVIGVREFVENTLTARVRPVAVYGVQLKLLS